jgi:hypothetical protein
MESFEWISSQDINSLVTPFPHGSLTELEEQLDIRIEQMLEGSDGMGPLESVIEAKTESFGDATKEDMEEARYLVNYKYRSWGYSSPQEMIDNEPGFEILQFFDEGDDSEFCEGCEEHRDRLSDMCYAELESFARAILNLQHHGVKDKKATFTFERMDDDYEKAVHQLVRENNESSATILPRLKIETIPRSARLKLSVEA